MTDAELYTLIQGDTQAAALYAEGNDEGCAVRCSAIAPPIRQPVDAGLLMDACMSLGIWQRRSNWTRCRCWQTIRRRSHSSRWGLPVNGTE